MRPWAKLCVAFVLAVSGKAADARSRRLEGCPEPATLASVLVRLSGAEWRRLSMGEVRAMWPSDLGELSCGADGCGSLVHQGRIINGHRQCGESFFVSVAPGGANREEGLDAVVIDYSSGSYEATVSVAKQLAMAAGLPGGKVAAIGPEPSQEFSWQDPRKEYISLVNLKFARVGGVWTLYFYYSRNMISDQRGLFAPG